MNNTINNVGVEILFGHNSAKLYYHQGNYYLEAKEGWEYEILVKNNNYNRILSIIGVDGLNVLDGKENSDSSPGYVINRDEKLKLKGYRINDNEVAAFKFSKKGDSYASGKSNNPQCGVITIKCFKEYIKPPKTIILKEKEYVPYPVYPTYPHRDPYWPHDYNPIFYYGDPIGTCNSLSSSADNLGQVRCCYSSSLQNSTANTPSDHFDMGSAWGGVKESKVKEVEFEKGSSLGKLNIYYASRQSLINMGINFNTEDKVVFPKGSVKYCSEPKGWKR